MKKILIVLGLLLSPQLALAQSPQPSNTYNVVSPQNVTPNDCSGTITTGGTSQYLIPATAPNVNPVTKIRGFMIMNVDTTSEGLCINFNGSIGSATCSTAGYYFLQPATSTAAGGSYSAQIGFGTNKNPTIVAATTGHKFSCTYW